MQQVMSKMPFVFSLWENSLPVTVKRISWYMSNMFRKSLSNTSLHGPQNSIITLTKSISGADSVSANNTKNTQHEKSELRIIAVDVPMAIDFSKIYSTNAHTVLYEIFAYVLSIRDGAVKCEKLILLRSGNSKPVLQAVFYETDVKLTSIEKGDAVRCVGNFIGTTRRFRIIKIAPCKLNDAALIQRLQVIGNYTMSKIQNQMKSKIPEKQDENKVKM